MKVLAKKAASMAVAISVTLLLCVSSNADRRHSDVESIGNRNVTGRVWGIFPNFVSLEKEIAIGAQVAAQFEQTARMIEDPVISEYVDRVGQNLVKHSDAKVPFHIKVVDTDEVNAFSGPTGYIMVTRGLLTRLGDESELAGVIAHETGHVVKRHGLDAVSKSEQWQGLVKIGTAAAGRNEQIAGVGKQLAELTLGSSYNQGQEREADVEAVRYLVAAGYDPQGYVRALQKAESGTGGGGFGKSHPATGDRIRNVQSEIARAGGQGGATNADRFQSYVGKLRR